MYTSQLLEADPRVTISVKDATVEEVLEMVFKGQHLDYEVSEHMIL